MKKLFVNFPFVAIILLCTFLVSCKKKCAENGIVDHYLSENVKAKIPYSGEETLTFIHETETGSEDVKLTGKGTKQYFSTKQGTDGDCNATIRKHAQDFNFYSADNSHILFYSISATETGAEFFTEFKGHKFKEDFSIIGNSNGKGFFNEMEFNGKTYKNVTEIIKKYPYTEARIYYTPEHGFIRFSFDKESWTLKH